MSLPQCDFQKEMLQIILSDRARYPWSPENQSSDDYFNNLESAWTAGSLFEEVFDSQWTRLSQQAEKIWAMQPSILSA